MIKIPRRIVQSCPIRAKFANFSPLDQKSPANLFLVHFIAPATARERRGLMAGLLARDTDDLTANIKFFSMPGIGLYRHRSEHRSPGRVSDSRATVPPVLPSLPVTRSPMKDRLIQLASQLAPVSLTLSRSGSVVGVTARLWRSRSENYCL